MLDNAHKLATRGGRPRHGNPWRQRVKHAMMSVLPRSWFLVRGPASGNSLCLTFDDGPHSVNTPQLLDVLKGEGVVATFFLVGKNVERHPEIVRRIWAEGHIVAHHTYSHSRPATQSPAELIAEIRQTDQLFRQILGVPSKLFRPPWGKLGLSKFVRVWAIRQGIVLWTSDPRDCERKDVDAIRTWFRANPLVAGDILLMHDDQPFAAEVLPEVIAEARRRGLGFSTPLEWMGRRKAAGS